MTNKLLPIAPGCRAVVMGATVPENNGKFVTVLGFIGSPGTSFEWDDWWRIDRDLTTSWGRTVRMAPTCQLLRIDGGDFESEHIRDMCQDLIDMMDASGL